MNRYKPDPLKQAIEDVLFSHQRDYETPHDLAEEVIDRIRQWQERMDAESTEEAMHLMRVLESPEARDRGL